MKRSWLAGLVAVLVFAGGCSAGSDSVDQQAGGENRYVAGDGTVSRYSVGKRPAAPQVSGSLLDGKKFDLAKYRGKVVVFNFWGEWCAPCRAEAHNLEQVYTATKDSGVRFIGVNVRDSRDRAKAFEHSYGITYPSIFDPDGRVALTFRKTPPNSIPSTIVIDRKGRVAAVFRKALLTEDLQPVVEQVTKEK